MDEQRLLQLTTKQRLDRDLHELEGILLGIAIDGQINPAESLAMQRWCNRHGATAARAPFDELVPLIQRSTEDGILDLGERRDIEAAIARIRTPNEFYNLATADMQRLHGILAGIASDGRVNDQEVAALATWLEGANNLRGMWPYDEVYSLVVRALADGAIDSEERRAILGFCAEFTRDTIDLLVRTPFDEKLVRQGVCAMDPEIVIRNRVFCFTGKTVRATRTAMCELVEKLGGRGVDVYSRLVDYLVICSAGSAAWAFTVYGRKIEAAMQDRRAGDSRVMIVQEADFWDAVEDAGGARPAAR